ncbi:chorismate-binding protein [soil metagenome]
MTSAAVSDAASVPLVARSVEIGDPGPLIDLLPQSDPVAWLRHGEGVIGWGVAARISTSGADRFADAQRWWDRIVEHAVVRDEVRLPGSGLTAFGTFGFDDETSAESVLVVPQVLVGARSDRGRRRTWVTVVGLDGIPSTPVLTPADVAPSPQELRFSDGSLTGAEWMSAVRRAVGRIESGELEKVVLARDLLAQAAGPVDARWPLRRLARAYPGCWTYHVDGLVGATPEVLVRRERGLVSSRVLAGTIRRTGDDQHDLALAAALARSSKDLEEHEYAVRSVADGLAPHCSTVFVPETPFVLHLPNVMHLATDVTGVLTDNTGALALATSLHPSAAVGGTPSAGALRAIADLEQMDRDRYAAPVGWMSADGDGEWGIALRCGRITGDRVRLFAGCGIVADSQAEAELAEAQAKFVPMRDALGPL